MNIKRPAYLICLLSIFVGQLSANEQLFKRWDKNGDGFLSRGEIPKGPQKMFNKKDANSDGKISLQEHLGKGKGGSKPPRRETPTQAIKPGTFSIRQSWPQETEGYDRPVYVAEPKSKPANSPVLIYLHGNGGNAERALNNWARSFPNYLIVAPQGYERSWNVQGEKSQAPDVSFFQAVVEQVGKRYPYADMQNVSLIGSSNGGAYIYRLIIELEQNDLFQCAVPMVSSLLESQHHDGNFWKSKDESNTAELTEKATPPSNPKLRLLYLHGTADKVVPFDGGKRFGKYLHHSALATANILARHLGYSGDDKTANDAREVETGLLVQDFEGTNFSYVAVTDGSHGLQPHRDKALALVKKFIETKR